MGIKGFFFNVETKQPWCEESISMHKNKYNVHIFSKFEPSIVMSYKLIRNFFDTQGNNIKLVLNLNYEVFIHSLTYIHKNKI
jgi:hypothetical protein